MAEAVERLASEYLDLVSETFPTEATGLGRHQHDGRLEDLTEAGLDGFWVHRVLERELQDPDRQPAVEVQLRAVDVAAADGFREANGRRVARSPR